MKLALGARSPCRDVSSPNRSHPFTRLPETAAHAAARRKGLAFMTPQRIQALRLLIPTSAPTATAVHEPSPSVSQATSSSRRTTATGLRAVGEASAARVTMVRHFSGGMDHEIRACGGLAALFTTMLVTAQPAATPFKLGTFERQGRAFVGIVLREAVVIDLAAAHAAITTPASSVAAPSDMKDLIARYDSGLRARIVEIVRTVGDTRPAYVYDVGALKILPPIMYPTTMLNVAVNYREHDIEMARVRQGDPNQAAPTAGAAPPGTVSAPGIWERAAERHALEPVHVRRSCRAPSSPKASPCAFPSAATADRVGVRARRRDRPARGTREPSARDGLRLRLHAAERHVGPRRTRRHALRLGLAHHEEPRHVRAAGPVHHAEGVRRRHRQHGHDVRR